MKTLLLALILALTACETTTPSGGTPPASQVESVQRTAAIVEMSAQLATYGVLRTEPDNRPYFETSVLFINTSISKGQYDPDEISRILANISINDKNSEIVFISVTATLGIYRIVWADAVDKNLDKNAYVRPVLEALSRGITLGLNSISTEKKFNLKRR